MAGLHFYWTLDEGTLFAAKVTASEYEFFYRDGMKTLHPLEYRPNPNGSDIGDNGLWSLEHDGISFKRTVSIGDCGALYGRDGVCPSGGELGVCLLWKIEKLSMAGVAYPLEMIAVPKEGPKTFRFSERFGPADISGDLSLDIVLYVRKPAAKLLPGEDFLINEAGVTLGSLVPPLTIGFENKYMCFPVEEVCEPGQPMWWIEFYDWSDPREDMFSEEHVALKINAAVSGCPRVNNKGAITNMPMLVEILASAYFVIFQKVLGDGDDDVSRDTQTGANVEPQSISDMLYQFSRIDPDVQFKWNASPEVLMRCIKRNVESCFKGGRVDG